MQPVLSTVEGSIGVVTLNRPGEANALDLPTAEALEQILPELEQNPEVRVVLLRGDGRLFCSGGDLAAMNAAEDRSAYLRELVEAAHRVVDLLQNLTKPVVVAVQGAAAGIGFSLALGADLVVATRSATFVTAYTTVGLTPDGGMSWLLPRVIGQQRALDLILTGRPLPAEQAQAWGVVSRLCDDEDLDETARELAETLVGRPAEAQARSRRLVRQAFDHPLNDHLGLEADSITEISATEETGRAIARFLDR